MPDFHTLRARIAFFVVAVSGLLILGAELVPLHDHLAAELFRLGIGGAVLGSLMWVLAVCRISEEFVERVRQQAWDEGYAEGESAASESKLYLLPMPSVVASGMGAAE